jgi:hypothetical protein
MKYGVNLPAVFLVKRNDAKHPRVVFDQDYSTKRVVEFIRLSSLTSFVSSYCDALRMR